MERNNPNKMNTYIPERNSRRSSSILKGSKAQNPSQAVESPSPSRLKRRVSFAEKKHVKEFSDSMEQGTVWDNTYEESDSSHMARSHHDENHLPLTHQSAPLDDSDDSRQIFEPSTNQQKNLYRRPPILELNFVGPHVIDQNPQLYMEKENIPIDPMADLEETEDEIIFPIQNTQEKFEIYCDGENSPLATDKHKNTCENDSSDVTLTLTESKCFDLTNDETGGMEMTEVIQSVHTATKTSRKSIFDGMEMTEALSSVLPTMESDKTAAMKKSIFNDEQTQIFHHHGMEMTEPISSVCRPQKPPRKSVLISEGMKIIEQISSPLLPRVEGEKSQPVRNTFYPFPHSKTEEESTQMVNRHGMEMTEPISSVLRPQKPGRKSLVNREEMEMTEAISSVLRPQKPGRKSVVNREEMEMTEAITSVLNSKKSSRKSILNAEGMEMTEVINCLLPSSEPEESTQFFYKGGLDLTEAIAPSFPPVELPEKSQIQELSEPLDIQNYFMELTEAIPSLKRPYSTISPQTTADSNLTSPRAKSPKDYAPFHPIVPSQHDKEALHRLLHSDPENLHFSPPNLQNQSMEFTSAITSHFKPQNPPDNCVSIPQDKSMEITGIIPPLSSFRPQIGPKDIDRSEEARPSVAVGSSSEVESSDSFKENRAPPGENPRTHPVARPLFERRDDEVSDVTPTPLEDSEEIEGIRSRPKIGGRNFDDLTIELTTVIATPQEDNGTLSSSDLQNIEAPSFMFADSVSDENSFSKSGSLKIDEEMRDFGGESRRNAEQITEERVDSNWEAIRFGDQEMTCDIRPVPIPEVEFTEEITNFEDRRRTRVLERQEEEEIIKDRRTCNITSVDTSVRRDGNSSVDDRRRNHTICRHEEEEKEVIQRTKKSGTYVINKQLSTASVEIDGKVLVETFKETTVVNCESKMAEDEQEEEQRVDNSAESGKDIILEKNKRVRSDNYLVNIVDDEMNVEFDIREREINSVKVNPQEDKVENKVNKVNENNVPSLEELSHRAKILKENDLIIKRIKKCQKQEELIRQKREKAQKNSPELTSKPADDSQMKDNEIEEKLSAFESMKRSLEKFSGTRGCMWRPYLILKERVSVEFNKTAFLFGVTFHVPDNDDEMERIDEFYTIGRLNSGEKSILKMTDRLIVDRINRSTADLKRQFRNYDHVLSLIKAVTEEVRFIYDFYEELKKMSYRILMEIELDRLSFFVTTNSSDTILKIFMNIKSFDEIGPDDIDVHCVLGNVRKSDIKELIKNVKRNHKFITLYKNDVKDYIELMEASSTKRLGK